MKPDQYERLRANPRVDVHVIKPTGWITAAPNHKQGLMTNRKLRQALQAALDMQPIMTAAIGNAAFFRVDGALYFPEQGIFHTQVGVTGYNLRNKERARALLKETGYTGQPVRWITTKEYDYMYNSALVARQQMEEVGFKVDLQVLDWATLVQRRSKPELWDLFTTGITFGPDPALDVQSPVRLAGLVVPRGQGAAAGRADPRERPEEAPGAHRAHPGRLLRRRRPHQDGRLFRDVRQPRPQGLPGQPVPALLEHLARPLSGVRRPAVPCAAAVLHDHAQRGAVLQDRDVGEGIAVDQQEIGEGARLHGPSSPGLPMISPPRRVAATSVSIGEKPRTSRRARGRARRCRAGCRRSRSRRPATPGCRARACGRSSRRRPSSRSKPTAGRSGVMPHWPLAWQVVGDAERGSHEDAVARGLERVERSLVAVVGVVDDLDAVPHRHPHRVAAAAVSADAQAPARATSMAAPPRPRTSA